MRGKGSGTRGIEKGTGIYNSLAVSCREEGKGVNKRERSEARLQISIGISFKLRV